MDKYQEALDELCSRCYVDSDKCTCHPRYKDGKCNSNCEYRQLLQELVDKENPMKVEYFYGFANDEPYNAECSKCGYILGKDFIPSQERDKYFHSYCPCCGQKIDWSEENEN